MQSDTSIDRLLTPREAAKVLGVSESWLAKARMRGDGPPFVKIGRSIRYKISGLNEYVRNRTRRSTTDAGSPGRGRPSTFQKVAPVVVDVFDKNGWKRCPELSVLKLHVERAGRSITEQALRSGLRRLLEETGDPKFRA
jgi:predicted DNA-binding transcriptional regulator AlpA